MNPILPAPSRLWLAVCIALGSSLAAQPTYANESAAAPPAHAAPAAKPAPATPPAATSATAHGSAPAATGVGKPGTPGGTTHAVPAGASGDAAPAGARKGPPPPIDPIDRLRERLAQKLAAQPAPDRAAGYDLKVSQQEPGDLRFSRAEKPAAAAAPARPRARASTAAAHGGRPAATAAPRSATGAHGAAPGGAGAAEHGTALGASALHAATLGPTSRLPVPPAANGHGAAGGAGHGEHAHWSYAGETGPQSWGNLKPEFAACSTGQRQSPIDIRDGIRVELEPIQFDYQSGPFAVVDNGHTVQVNVAPGSAIRVLGRRYELKQFHFHRPSEERVLGRQYDMDIHLVHKDAEGRLAVVAVLLEAGTTNPTLQQVWNNLPLERNEEQSATTPLHPANLLPKERRYYTYMGSLTTPPCSEGVLWMVLQQPVPVSPEQVGVFSRLYPMNARPVQQQAGRLIKMD